MFNPIRKKEFDEGWYVFFYKEIKHRNIVKDILKSSIHIPTIGIQ